MDTSLRDLPPPNRRRDKPQIVCNTCRKGKLRCDRAHPCGPCIRRGVEYACVYASAAPSVGKASVETDLGQRIKELEQLVKSMLPHSIPPSVPDGTNSQIAPAPAPFVSLSGQVEDGNLRSFEPNASTSMSSTHRPLRQVNGSYHFTENTHWTAILDEIHEVQEVISTMNTQRDRFLFAGTVVDIYEPDILFGHYPRLNKQQLIAALPQKTTVDLLVNDYFNNKCIDTFVVHKPSFYNEYEEFWGTPTGASVSIVWIAQLYAITALSAHHHDQPTPLLPDPKRFVQVHMQKTIETLVLGRYTSCPSFTVETLSILYQLSTLRAPDTDIDSSLLLTMTIKLATRQGYHRDASQFSNITAQEGEMRRRVWATILLYDAQSAISTGLPRTLRPPYYDTAEPVNLLDGDFHIDDEMLPLARAYTVNTPVQFLVLENRLFSVYGTITELLASGQPLHYNEIMSADMSLNNMYASIPIGLRMFDIPTSGAIQIPRDVLVRRIYLALIYGEAKCVLHRGFINDVDPQHAYSRKRCVEAALEVLSYQMLLEIETQHGGRMFQERWKIDKTARNSFLLATSILCLYLSISANRDSTGREEQDLWHKALASLEQAQQIWTRVNSLEGSVDAVKAAKAVEIVLNTIAQDSTRNGKNPAGASEPTQTAPRNQGIASIHSLLMQNSGVDYTSISARHGI